MHTCTAITYEVERGRARITLNRPDKLNALSPTLLSELHDALWEADDDREVHGVILRGAGRCFSSGYDLTPPSASAAPGAAPRQRRRGYRRIDDDAWQLERAQRLRMALFDMHKPVVAQLHGYCLAGGTDIALLCDIIIAAQDAVIGFPRGRATSARCRTTCGCTTSVRSGRNA